MPAFGDPSSGYRHTPFNPPKDANNLGLFSDFGNAFSAFLEPLMKSYGGTGYGNWLQNNGASQIRNQFEAQQQADILFKRKNEQALAQKYGFAPDDPFFLALLADPAAAKGYGYDFGGWNPLQITEPLDFLKALNPLAIFQRQSQQQRGEDPRAFNPMGRYTGT